MTSSSRPATFAAVMLAIVAVIGCGDQDRGFLTGTVTLNGQPVGPGTLTLRPVNSAGAGAMALFGEDGKYEVMTSGREKGAPVGEYRVFIQGGEDFGAEQEGPPPESEIPVRYNTPDGSDLTVTIEPGNHTHDFELQP